jgi:hypothetical protein
VPATKKTLRTRRASDFFVAYVATGSHFGDRDDRIVRRAGLFNTFRSSAMFRQSRMLFLSWICFAASVPLIHAQQPPTIEQIAKAGRQTTERLTHEAASWTTVYELKNGVEAHVEVIETPTMRHTRVSLRRDRQSDELARVTARDNLWYVEDPSGHYKYRPYEAIWFLPATSMFYSRSGLRAVNDDRQPLGTFLKLDGDVAIFSSEMPEPLKNQLESTLANLQKLEKEAPDSAKKIEMQSTKKQIQQMLESGITTHVNVKSGIVEQIGAIGHRVWIKNFKWLARPDSDVFKIDHQTWVDRSSNLVETARSLDDLIMISHAASWRPGQPSGDRDFLLMNIKTNETRRIPFALGVVANACFSKDRKSIYVAGQVPDEGGTGIFELNLLSAAHRRLGNAELGSGIVMFPALSPDGKYLVALRLDQRAGPLQSQVVLVDIESGGEKPIGQPLDISQASWLPSGDGFVLVSRKHVDLSKPSIDTICRMDLTGKITAIRKGSLPLVLHPRSVLLYLDDDQHTWNTCNLDGGDVKILGDGLSKFNFPTLAPDGKQLIMMKFGGANGPQPHLVDVETGTEKPIPVGPGLWATPTWR